MPIFEENMCDPKGLDGGSSRMAPRIGLQKAAETGDGAGSGLARRLILKSVNKRFI